MERFVKQKVFNMPTTAQLIVFALLQYGPDLAIAVREILTVEKPTDEQWNRVFEKAKMNYRDLVPNTRLPATERPG